MRLTSRDLIASAFVGAGLLIYALWLFDAGWSGAAGVRVVAAAVLAFGFVASASAVVPGFGGLLRNSKTYLVGASLLGSGALAAGLWALLDASSLALGLLVGADLLLWAGSTIRHALAVGGSQPESFGRGKDARSPVAI
jgi:hypothetical protein